MSGHISKKYLGLFIFLCVMAAPHTKAQVQPPLFVASAIEVTGKVTAKDLSGKKRKIELGDTFLISEEISTGRNAFIKIRLKDDTEFTLGEKSQLNINNFVYDESSHEGKVSAYLEGTFRFITGKIAEYKSEDMVVNTTTAVIGVRGTKVAGESNKSKSTIILEKPDNPKAKQTSIVVSSEVDGKKVEVEIKEYGFGTTVNKGKAPRPPVKISQKVLDKINDKLKPESNDSDHSPLSPFGAYDQVKRGVKGVANVVRKVDPRGMKSDSRPKPPPKSEPKHDHHHQESS